ncbi:MAG: hypothetical protein KA368_16130 [Acidobacteria bacterium]|nr:hypothetical protein [Acidobacteriota bacterium]
MSLCPFYYILIHLSATLTAQESYADLQGDFVGLDQVNIRLIPSLTGRGGEIDLVLTADNAMSNVVRIDIR